MGDRYVVERMRQGGFNLGGEQSGHIVMTDYSTTGDGLMAGLQFLAEMVRSGKKASDACKHLYPRSTVVEKRALSGRSNPA